MEFNDRHSLAVTLRNIASMAPNRPGTKDGVAEVLGLPPDEVQKLFDTLGSNPDESQPGSAAAAGE